MQVVECGGRDVDGKRNGYLQIFVLPLASLLSFPGGAFAGLVS